MPKRMQGGFVSQFLNDRANPGLMVIARGPYGQFCFDADKHRRIVLIAGGSGITPMMSILRYIQDLGIPVPCTLIYCVRSEKDLVFNTELSVSAQIMSSFRYVPVVSNASPEWRGWNGRLCRQILEEAINEPLECTYFLCGPTGFMELGRALLEEMSVHPSQILQESFGDQARKDERRASEVKFVNVTFSRSDLTIASSPERTLLETAQANGVPIPFGCRQGDCHTCMTRLLQGNVHVSRDEPLEHDLRVQGFILPCVSRPLNDITLDA